MALHKNLTDPELHESKGVAAAPAGKVFITDGAGSGTWQNPPAVPPSAHASTHASAGVDPVTISESQVTGLVTDLAAKEATANKNQPSGYAGLDASSKLTGSQQIYGSAANTACQGNDSRLSDSRPPNGSASGDLTGSYPGPTIAALAVTDSKVAAANKDGLAGTASMRTLGTGAQQACGGTDARLSDDRTASGLRTATTVVATAAAAAPTVGQVLTATAGNAASWQAPTFKQSAMVEVTTDQTSTPASLAWADLLTLNITTGVGFLLMRLSAGLNCSNASSRQMGLRLLLDGVAVRAVANPSSSISVAQSFDIVARKAVTAGAHVVKVQWEVAATYSIYCRPVTVPDQEHCTLVVEEVTV